MPNAVTVNTGSAGCTIVARPVAALDASGEASLVTLEQVTVSVSYDDLYSVTLSDADAIKLLNSFTLDGSGTSFACTLDNSADFQEVLTRAMSDAAGVSYTNTNASIDVVGNTLSQNLMAEILATFKSIYEDTIPNVLQSDWDISNNVAYAAGAQDMADKLVPEEAELLAQQLPESNYIEYMDASENTTTHALPLKRGDKLVFVFYLREAAVARVDKKTPGSTVEAPLAAGVAATAAAPPTNATAGTSGGSTVTPAASAAAAGQSEVGTGPYGDSTQTVTYASNTRTVAFELVMSSGTAPFDVGASGLKA
jgi:hypothetical protein